MDTDGKLFERILFQRLFEHLDRTGELSPNQFGFRVRRSTGDAITKVLDTAKSAGTRYSQYQEIYVLVALDTMNAFNSAPWAHIDKALRARETPDHLTNILRSDQ